MLVFLLIAVGTAVVRQAVQAQQFDLDFDLVAALQLAVLQSPYLFLGAFMLSEPLTLPPRRFQQFWVAALVGVLAGWPISVAGLFTLGQERALLIGNLLAFCFALRGAVRLTLQKREFSIVSAPAELPTLRIAYKNSNPQYPSSYKLALAAAEPGAALAVTGTWGDFVLPRGESPVLMVAAGIGVTPFVSQLRQLQADGITPDVVLVYVASDSSELAFRDELEATGVPTVVFCRDTPAGLPAHWTWARGIRGRLLGLLTPTPTPPRAMCTDAGPRAGCRTTRRGPALHM